MFYQQFCHEEFDLQGKLTGFQLRFPDNYNFGYDVVDRLAVQTPEKRALVWCNSKAEERTFSFGDLAQLSNQAANVLTARGVKKGDRVMLILKRSWEYWYVIVALHKIGAIAVPTSHMLTYEDLSYRFNKIGISAVIAFDNKSIHQLLERSKKECPSVQSVWTTGENAFGFYNLAEDVSKAPKLLERVATLAKEPMIIYFTSGTTNYPKAVAHDHAYTLAHILTAKYWQQVEEGSLHFTVADTGWGKASWGKIYGQWILGAGVLVFDFESFDSRQLATVMNKYQVTSFCAPPTVYRHIVRRESIQFSSLKYATSAGEYLHPEIAQQFENQTGIRVAEGYGQTETTLQIANLIGDEIRYGSMGKQTPLYEIQILKEDGSLAETGELGEIVLVLKKDQQGIMMGYLEEGNISNHRIQNGLYRTGDSAWKDEDGYFWYKGRIDDVIKTRGFRVGPVEIENVIIKHPFVLECSVVGMPDPSRGQAIRAIIVPMPDTSPTEEMKREILCFANSKLAVFKRIRQIDFVDELPKTSNGKILRRAG